MTREEIEELKGLAASMGLYDDKNPCKRAVILGKAIKALDQEPTTKNDLVTLTFSKGTLKYSCKDYVVYKKDWLRNHYGAEIDIMFGDSQYKEPITKNDLGVDCVARQDVERYIEGFINEYTPKEELEFINLELDGLKHLPSVTPQEPRKDEVILTKEEYGELVSSEFDNGYAKGYREALEQEPILEKINKMKSEIASSLEFWDYSPNNNPLARDILETVTHFWGDIKAESEE